MPELPPRLQGRPHHICPERFERRFERLPILLGRPTDRLPYPKITVQQFKRLHEQAVVIESRFSRA